MSAKLALTGTLSALAVVAVSAVGVTAAADEPARTVSATVVDSPQQDAEHPSSAAGMGPMMGQLGEMWESLPDDLRQDLEDAENGDPGDTLRALADVHEQAAAGDYGAEVQEQVERLDAGLPTEADLRQMAADHLGALPIEIPRELREALVQAAGNGDAGDRLVALADVHDGALAGDYGPQARTLVQQLGRFLDQMDSSGGFPGMGSLGA